VKFAVPFFSLFSSHTNFFSFLFFPCGWFSFPRRSSYSSLPFFFKLYSRGGLLLLIHSPCVEPDRKFASKQVVSPLVAFFFFGDPPPPSLLIASMFLFPPPPPLPFPMRVGPASTPPASDTYAIFLFVRPSPSVPPLLLRPLFFRVL